MWTLVLVMAITSYDGAGITSTKLSMENEAMCRHYENFYNSEKADTFPAKGTDPIVKTHLSYRAQCIKEKDNDRKEN